MQQNQDPTNLTAPATSVSTLGYVDYSDIPKTITNKKKAATKVVKKSKPRKSGQGYLICLGRN